MLLIKNGYIKSMAGPDIPNGCVLIGDDGKILSTAATYTLKPTNDMTVTAAGNKADKGWLKLFMRQVVGADMPLYVMHRNKRPILRV